MLVLTRKVGEEILIGDQIYIKVIEISGNKVRLGIDAPANLRIYREEILAKSQKREPLCSGVGTVGFPEICGSPSE